MSNKDVKIDGDIIIGNPCARKQCRIIHRRILYALQNSDGGSPNLLMMSLAWFWSKDVHGCPGKEFLWPEAPEPEMKSSYSTPFRSSHGINAKCQYLHSPAPAGGDDSVVSEECDDGLITGLRASLYDFIETLELADAFR
jgi:hypothetical protein